MTDGLDLSPRHRATIQALIERHLPDVEVWAYGSRIDGRGHAGSDLDLALRAPGLAPIPVAGLARLKEALRDSNIPFVVEAHDWARLPEGFRRRIERGHVVLWGGSSNPVKGP